MTLNVPVWTCSDVHGKEAVPPFFSTGYGDLAHVNVAGITRARGFRVALTSTLQGCQTLPSSAYESKAKTQRNPLLTH